QLAEELVDEVAAVGQDQDAAGARGVDEAERGHRLAGAGRVLEPEAAGGIRVLGLLVDLDVVVQLAARVAVPGVGLLLLVLFLFLAVLFVLVPVLVLFLLGKRLGDRAVGAGAVARAALELGHERHHRARQRVYLVGVQDRAIGQLGLVLSEQSLE